LDLSGGCVVAAQNQTNIWDAATGVDLGIGKSRAHIKAWVGARTSDYVDPTNNPDAPFTNAFYREGYIRYDMVFRLAGPFSLQFQGFHRHRFEPLLDPQHPKPFTEGENYTALQWSPHISAIFGYEYFAKEQCEPARAQTLSQPARPQRDFCNYVNGGIQWRAAGVGADKPSTKYVAQLFDSVNLFVGQRRGAIRCVSGVCRQFPPFEGARLEITSRF
jgi:hypothetical protein